MAWMNHNTANVLESAGAGAFLSMLMQPKIGWRPALLIFSAGIATAYFFGGPISFLFAKWTGADPVACLPVSGFTTGFAGLYFASAATVLLDGFAKNPLGVVSRMLKAWRGNDGNDAGA